MTEHRHPPIESVERIAKWIYPEFTEVNGLVLVAAYVDRKRLKQLSTLEFPLGQGVNRSTFEWHSNHTHIIDLVDFDEDIYDRERSRFRRRHPHFKLADKLGRLMARSWTAKLILDFPDDDFIVHYSSHDNPIVRFHKIHPGERPYFDGPVDNREETVYDTRTLRSPNA